jgi:hypothetical protein
MKDTKGRGRPIVPISLNIESLHIFSMDLDGKGIGMLAVLGVALLIVGFVLSNAWFYLIGGIVLVIFLFGALGGAKGSLRIKDIFPS